MTPTFYDFFKAFYYTNTYLPPVDLSEQGLSRHLLEKVDVKAAEVAKSLISAREVQKVLSETLSYDLAKAVPENIDLLMRHGFKMLSSKPNLQTRERVPFYSVIEHDELQGWIIKSGAARTPKEQLLLGPMNDRNEMAFFTEEESLLRIEMAERIAKVAKEAHIEVVIPEKKLVTYANLDGVSEPNRQYCVVCKKNRYLKR